MLEIKSSHQRNQSDEIGQMNNHSNLVTNGKYFNMQGKTIANTNMQSMVGSNVQNTNNFNSAIGSNLASHRANQPQKKMNNSQTTQKSGSTGAKT